MKQISLSAQDIDYISRVVETEVSPGIRQRDPVAYSQMAGAVVDTITNRLATGKYPSLSAVVNAPRQFTKIAGPRSAKPYGSVQKAPAASSVTRAAVERQLAERSLGKPSLIGGALNYANPNYSDRKNIEGWIGPMEDAGAVKLGIGKQSHIHGLAPGVVAAPEYSLSVPKSVVAHASLAGPMQRYDASFPDNLAYERSLPDIGPVPTAAVRQNAAPRPTSRPAPPSTMSALNASPRPTSAVAALNAALARPAAPSQPPRSQPARPVTRTPQNPSASVNARMDMSPSVSPAARPASLPANVSARMAPITTAMEQAMTARPTTPAMSPAQALSLDVDEQREATRRPLSMPARPVSPTPTRTAPKAVAPAFSQNVGTARVSPASMSLPGPVGPRPTNTAAISGTPPSAGFSAAPREAAVLGGPFSSAMSTLGRAISPSPAAAATMTNAPARAAPAPARAPVSTGFAGSLGSPRSMEATIAGPMAANRFSPAPSAPVSRVATPAARTASLPSPMQASIGPSVARAAPTPNFAGTIGSPRAMEAASMASLAANSAPKAFSPAPASFQQPAFSTAPRSIDALGQPPIAGLQPAPVAARQVPPLSAPVNVPARVVASVPSAPPRAAPPRAAPVQNMQAQALAGSRSFPGLPSVPSAPTQPGLFGRVGNYLGDNKAKIAGGLFGSAIAGPLGGLLGGYIGQRIDGGGGGTPSNAARAAAEAGWDGFGGMTSAQEAAARGAGSGSSGSKSTSSKGTSSKSSSGSSRGGGIGPGGGGARDSASR